MGKRPSLFKINNMKRTITATCKAGLVPIAVEVDPNGKIRVVVAGKPGEPSEDDTSESIINQL